MIINVSQHLLIGKVLEALNSIPDLLFEDSRMHIDIALKDKYGDFKVEFSDEGGEWTYEVVLEKKS